MARKLQMVGGSSYSHPGVKNGDQIKRGEIVLVEDDSLADALEAEFYLDGVDKECPYFVAYEKASSDETEAEVGEVKSVSKRRTARTSK